VTIVEGNLLMISGSRHEVVQSEFIQIDSSTSYGIRDLLICPVPGKMVTGFPQLRIEHDGICRGCALGTNAEGSFSSNDNRSKGILDFLHSDLCGPMTVASLSGSGLVDVTVTVTGWTLRDI
jgi:hypothetical protein